VELSWDRGTVLVRPGPGEEGVAGRLPGVLPDPRVAAWRAPGAAYCRVVDALGAALGAAGLAVRDRVLQPLPSPERFPLPPLRAYQEAALLAWEAAGRRGVVALPTGAGKTRVAIAAIARAATPALILVPTRVLLDQWVGSLTQAGLSEVGRHGDGERESRPVTVATFASALARGGDLGNRFGLLVVDEVHHFGAGAGDECLEMCAARWRLGLTATPPEDEARLAGLRVLVGPVVYRATIADLAGRFLAPLQLVTISLGLTAEERRAYDAEVQGYRPFVQSFFDAAPGAAWRDLVAFAGQSEAGRRALACWRRSRAMLGLTAGKRAVLAELLDRHRQARVLVFAARADLTLEIAREHLVPALTAEVGRAERERVLAHFRKGALRVIASAQVLNEGVDVPAAEVAIVVGGAQGRREHVQRVGRVLRPAEGKRAVVYELVTAESHEVAQAERRRRGLAGC
jgi:superfamily II DNA or RNA helicase